MHLLLALALMAASAPAPVNDAAACEKLWDDTVAAAAPDLDPSDDLRKGYLLREKQQLVMKCKGASAEVVSCPKQATAACAAKFPQPPDGGRALGLATCVYPEVQRCVQEGLIATASHGDVAALLAELESGKLAPEKGGLVKLTGERMLFSQKGEALAEKHDKGYWLLLVTKRAGARIDGVLLKSAGASALPASGDLTISGLHAYVVKAAAGGVRVSTEKP
ncbi:MAG: hypothetical protein JST54_20130 [Deltaproteobacteria bacterium]|nr:hypothetical protein [Deltaproteobacteria bacterium]